MTIQNKFNFKIINLKPQNLDSPSRPSDAPPPVPTSQPPHLFKEPVVELNCLVRISKATQNVNAYKVRTQKCLFFIIGFALPIDF